MIVRGKKGRYLYGQAIGILLSELFLPRIPGDIGNAATFEFPVYYKVVRGAKGGRLVTKEIDYDLLNTYIEAAKELETLGVKAITTSCGFLAAFQKEMSESVTIPVFTSSLIQVPLVSRMIGNRKVGIMTADSSSLTKKHLSSVGIKSEPIVIAGMADTEEFAKVFLTDRPGHYSSLDEKFMNTQKVKREMVEVARTLVSRNPEIGAIVFECTNMPPYAKTVQEETGLPVFDIVTLTRMVYYGVQRKEFVYGYI